MSIVLNHGHRYLAGATALLVSARASDNLTPAEVRSLLATTASFVPTSFNGNTPATLLQAGGGTLSVIKRMTCKRVSSNIYDPRRYAQCLPSSERKVSCHSFRMEFERHNSANADPSAANSQHQHFCGSLLPCARGSADAWSVHQCKRGHRLDLRQLVVLTATHRSSVGIGRHLASSEPSSHH